MNNIKWSFWSSLASVIATSTLLIACTACQQSTQEDPPVNSRGAEPQGTAVNGAGAPTETGGAGVQTEPYIELSDPNAVSPNASDDELFQDLLDNHWPRIFPNGRRNVGGPQFFKYIYEQLATNHDLFKRYSSFYCGVSGAIVRPTNNRRGRFDTVKIKDSNGSCIIGKYYRCCWPCVCDIMKHARAEEVTVTLPNDVSRTEVKYWVLTMGDPCHRCTTSPCEDLPPEVTTYQCQDGVTANGLRAKNGRLTTGSEGRLVFALLHDAAPASETEAVVTEELLNRCAPRINATPQELKRMGGMGNIFVDTALVNTDEPVSNSFDDLCE